MRWYDFAIQKAKENPKPNCIHDRILLSARNGDTVRTCLDCADVKQEPNLDLLPPWQKPPFQFYVDECADIPPDVWEALEATMERLRAKP